MSLQADINWAQKELAQIKDVHFMAKVKELLKQRPSADIPEREVSPMSYEELEDRLKRSEEDINAGHIHSTESLRDHFKNRVGK